MKKRNTNLIQWFVTAFFVFFDWINSDISSEG